MISPNRLPRSVSTSLAIDELVIGFNPLSKPLCTNLTHTTNIDSKPELIEQRKEERQKGSLKLKVKFKREIANCELKRWAMAVGATQSILSLKN